MHIQHIITLLCLLLLGGRQKAEAKYEYRASGKNKSKSSSDKAVALSAHHFTLPSVCYYVSYIHKIIDIKYIDDIKVY